MVVGKIQLQKSNMIHILSLNKYMNDLHCIYSSTVSSVSQIQAVEIARDFLL